MGPLGSPQHQVQEALTYQASKVSWVTAEFVRRPPAWMPRAFIYGLVLTLVAGITYASFAKVAIHVTARGVLRSDPKIMPVVVPVSLKVDKLHVRENQAVEKGAPLVDPKEELPQKELERLRETIAEMRALLAEHRMGRCRKCQTRLMRASKDALFVADVPEIEEVLAPARAALNRLLNAFAQYDQFDTVTASARRLIEVNSRKIEAVKARDAEALLQREIEQLTNEIVNAQNQIADRRQGLDESIVRTRDELDVQLTTALSALEVYRSQRNVIAPISGTVHRLALSGEGQFVAAGSEILQLIPKGATLVAELAVANRDIALLRVGLPVVIRLDAFPDRQYGTLNGTVQTVPLSTAHSDGTTPPTYSVLVVLERQSITKGKDEYPFRIGMQLEGRIVSRHESMLVNAVRRLLGISDSLDI